MYSELMKKRRIALMAVDVRSAYNVGSILRTADAMAVNKVYLAGITPYPKMPDDKRLPHVIAKAESGIRKTALGAEKTLDITHIEKPDIRITLAGLNKQGYKIVALEQTSQAESLDSFEPLEAIALVVGNEVKGLEDPILKLSDLQLAIPMLGRKESLNVAVATGIALYHLRFGP